jgi:hypothetical protein
MLNEPSADSGDIAVRPPLWSVRFAWVVFAFVVLSRAIPYIYHSIAGTGLEVALPEDDFYYYAVVAGNILNTGHSTFDGTISTNGYHPLWMGVQVVVGWMAGGITPTFFALLALVNAALSLVTFRLLLQLRDELFPQQPWTITIAFLVAVYAVSQFMFLGMEVSLTIPLYAWLMLEIARIHRAEEVDRNRMLRLGFIASLLALSRLDSILLIIMLLSGWIIFAQQPIRVKLKLLMWFCLGGQLLAYYFLWNLLAFDTLMPISGQAKQLLKDVGFSPRVLEIMTGSWDKKIAFVLIPAGIIAALVRYRQWRYASHRLVLFAMLLFPVVFFAVQGFLSDWHSFYWHIYFLVLAYLASTALLVRELMPLLPVRVVSVAGPIVLIAACGVVTVTGTRFAVNRTAGYTPDPWSRYHPARVLAEFAREHPGRYGMGDHAGLATYMLGQPVLQLEGLVGDGNLIEHIRREDDLYTVLCLYDIDYLIVSSYYPLADSAGCYHVAVPTVKPAGERSLKMKGDFCTQPMLYYNKGGWHTYIFAVDDCK